MRSGAAQIILVVGVILAAALGFFLGVEGAAISVGILALAFIGIVASRWQGSSPAPIIAQDAPPRLMGLILVVLALRLPLVALFYFTRLNLAVGPDSESYFMMGKLIAESWRYAHIDMTGTSGYSAYSMYLQLNGAAYWVFGDWAPLFLSTINTFLSVLVAWMASRIAGELFGVNAIKPAFLLCALMPSIVLWTSINLRDAWSFLALMSALWAAQRLRREFSVFSLLLLLGALALMPLIRGYLVPIVGLALIASYITVSLRHIPTAIGIVTGVLVAVNYVGEIGGIGAEVKLEGALERAHVFREGLAYGNSAVDTSIDISTPQGALLYLPRGVATFLFAPFPWSMNSWRQVIALPETFVWYYLFWMALKSMFRSLRASFTRASLLVYAALTITLAYGLVEGNEGTAYRHRAHVLFIYLVFAAGEWAHRRAQKPAPAPEPTPAPRSRAFGRVSLDKVRG